MKVKSNNRSRKSIKKRKTKLARRHLNYGYPNFSRPIMGTGQVTYEVAEKGETSCFGGIGAIHQMVNKLGLVESLNRQLSLLKIHMPYYESDHILNMTYNVVCGGTRLQDIERLRHDEAYMNALGADLVPDPTTAGDFLRRFAQRDIERMMDAINEVRPKLWRGRGRRFMEGRVYIDVDGTIAPTLGACKKGMDMSYKGVWGYAPLIVSLANTREVLYLVNRSGNQPSHVGAAEWMDRAINLVAPHAGSVCLRGDTDFSLTGHFDRWAESSDFVFGMDAHPTLVKLAENIEETAWRPLERKPKYTTKTEATRRRPDNIKEEIVKKREYKNQILQGEDIAELRYRPHKCDRAYRVVILRKNISVMKGENALFDEIRYFFYITTLEEEPAEGIVYLANERCDQENIIEQLKNGVNAMRMPVDDLLSNWAYMVIAALAWNLKSWFGLMFHTYRQRHEVIRMEYRRFLHEFILIPVQVIRRARSVILRIVGYVYRFDEWFSAIGILKRLHFT